VALLCQPGAGFLHRVAVGDAVEGSIHSCVRRRRWPAAGREDRSTLFLSNRGKASGYHSQAIPL
jgi:hypothetical protein